MSHNEITGDEIKSKVNSKEYEDNYDRIFKRKPQSLDAAYERRAMMQGLISSPLFDENKEIIMANPCKEAHIPTQGLWPSSEGRIDIIAQNGNDGQHYEENKD